MDATFLYAITDFGDSALMLPLAMALAVALWTQQSGLAALAWLGTLLPGLAAVTALKLVGHTCEEALATPSLVSPSGHAAFATMVYGSAGVIAARHLGGVARWLSVLLPAGIIAAVSVTRLLLSLHSALEVAIGLTIGAISVALFAQRYRTLPPAAFCSRRAGVLLAGAVLLLVTLHGERLHAEELIRTIAAELRTQVSVCR